MSTMVLQQKSPYDGTSTAANDIKRKLMNVDSSQIEVVVGLYRINLEGYITQVEADSWSYGVGDTDSVGS